MALCFICNRAILRGDGVRWVSHPILIAAQIAHARCFDIDWEFIEVGLDSFPPRSARRIELLDRC
jgi:hypothetical protein